jgi:hypothetical protein
MADTNSESIKPKELTQAQKVEAMVRKSILDDYFKKLNEGVSSFLVNRNGLHRKGSIKSPQANLPASLPMNFINWIQKSLDRHLETARDANEFHELIKQEFANVLILLDLFHRETRKIVEEFQWPKWDQSQAEDYVTVEPMNFSFASDLEAFLVSGPDQFFKWPLHVITLNKLFAEYQETKNWLADSPAATEVKDNRATVEKLLQPA